MPTRYSCPVCSEPLTCEANTFRCPKNHSFDKHKKGYVNLLLAQKKRSKTPGDDTDMVTSRRRFLRAEHYSALANAISSGLKDKVSEGATVLDAGCGEGYYLDEIAQKNPLFTCYGLDISKPAINAASQQKTTHWSVASSAHPPFLSNSFDAIISVFSRVDSNAFHRILKPNGWVCMAVPNQDHLMKLRELIYDDVRPYDTSKHETYLDSRFKLVEQQRIETRIHLQTQQAVQDLIGMTPHAHRLSATAKTTLAELSALDDKACFRLYWFQLNKAQEIKEGSEENGTNNHPDEHHTVLS